MESGFCGLIPPRHIRNRNFPEPLRSALSVAECIPVGLGVEEAQSLKLFIGRDHLPVLGNRQDVLITRTERVLVGLDFVDIIHARDFPGISIGTRIIART